MTNREVGEALAHGRPGEEFFYLGDGASLDDLDWRGNNPAPTWDEVAAWRADLDANPPALAPTMEQKIAAALQVVQSDPALAAETKQALTEMVSALAPPAS